MSRTVADALPERLRDLEAIVTLGGRGRLPEETLGRAREMSAKAATRLGHGSAHTVVALAGATGSGKSSTFNSVLGEELAPVGVRRPTTSETRAAVVGGGADQLLDWLEVHRRHVVGDDRSDLAGLVLLDLPDHDSIEAGHQREVERLVEVVDAFVWVVDPQKYADAALHDGYLRRFAGHSAVTVVVLNQVDLLAAEHRRATVEHLTRLLVEDGLGGVRVMAASTATGEGIDELRRELAALVAERRALVTRLDADVDRMAADLSVDVGDVTPGPVDKDQARRLVDRLATAAGVDGVADAVGAAHRHRASQVAGWPPIRWVGRLRPDPLRRLGLDRVVPGAVRPGAVRPGAVRPGAGGRDPGAEAGSDGAGVVPRTSRPEPTAVAQAGVDEALRSLTDRTTEGFPDLWRQRAVTVARARRDDLTDALDQAVGAAELPTSRPRWWSAASAVQWLATAALVAGIVWLAAIGAVAWLGLPDLPTPEVGSSPLPTALALIGALVGWLVALISRRAAAVGGRRRAAQARKRLVKATETVAQNLVLGPLNEELADLADLSTRVRSLVR